MMAASRQAVRIVNTRWSDSLLGHMQNKRFKSITTTSDSFGRHSNLRIEMTGQRKIAFDNDKGEAFAFEKATHKIVEIPQKICSVHSLIHYRIAFPLRSVEFLMRLKCRVAL